MMVTSQILAASHLNPVTLNSARKEESSTNEQTVLSSATNANEQDILSIARENKRAVEFSLSSFMEAVEKLNSVKDYLYTNPDYALSLQGNIAADSASLLL